MDGINQQVGVNRNADELCTGSPCVHDIAQGQWCLLLFWTSYERECKCTSVMSISVADDNLCTLSHDGWVRCGKGCANPFMRWQQKVYAGKISRAIMQLHRAEVNGLVRWLYRRIIEHFDDMANNTPVPYRCRRRKMGECPIAAQPVSKKTLLGDQWLE